MSVLLLVCVSVAGGVGAALRFVLDGTLRSRWPFPLPLGTLVINVSGSFVLGLVTGLASGGVLGTSTASVLGTGMMGGYTTFSTASVETVQLFRSGRTGLAVVNGLGMLVVSVGASALGLWIGRNP